MKLTIAEKFLLIAKHPDKGRFVVSDVQMNFGLVGAILMDLSLNGDIQIENGILNIISKGNSNNPVNTEVIGILNRSEKKRKVKWWIRNLVRKAHRYKWDMLGGLEQRNIISIGYKRFMGIIPYRRSYLLDKYLRQEILNQLRNGILFQKNMTRETIVLLSLVEACKIHKLIAADKQEVKTVRQNLTKLMEENPIANSIGETIKEVQVAVAASAMAAGIAATAGGGN